LFGLFWFLFTIIPTILLFDIPIQPLPIAYISLCAASFSLSSLVFDWRMAYAINSQIAQQTKGYFETKVLRMAFYLSAVLALGLLTINSTGQGFSITDVAGDLTVSAAQYAARRMSGDLQTLLSGQLSLITTYVAASIGGLLLANAGSPRTKLVRIAFALGPAAVLMVTQSAKGALFLSVALLYGGLLAGWLKSGRLGIVSRRAIPLLTLLGLLLLVLVGFSFRSRGLYFADQTPEEVRVMLTMYFRSYFFGHLYAFADWFTFVTGGNAAYPYMPEAPAFGFYTFHALFRLVGSNRYMSMGVFDERFEIGGLLITNIYTIFRSLITDFGLVGCVGFFFVTGWILHRVFYSLLVARRPVISLAVFIMMIGAFVHSNLSSLLMYANFYACIAALAGVFFVNKLALAAGDSAQAASQRLRPALRPQLQPGTIWRPGVIRRSRSTDSA
jgi:oligosaccharide repeat unit polymerase